MVRDPIACKPAVMAETDQYVAFGSEYRALVNLPGIEDARVWEPEPATVYFGAMVVPITLKRQHKMQTLDLTQIGFTRSE